MNQKRTKNGHKMYQKWTKKGPKNGFSCKKSQIFKCTKKFTFYQADFLDKIWTFGLVCIWLCHKTDHGIAQLAFEMLFVFLHACPFVSKPARDEAPPTQNHSISHLIHK